MKIIFDPDKRLATLLARKVDFLDAEAVFAGPTIEYEDARRDYGETRMITVGLLNGRMVLIGWTLRGDARHVFTMRKCNARERKKYAPISY